MLSPIYESRLDDLLAAWRYHYDQRKCQASLPELANARRLLDAARDAAWRTRRALNPTEAELAESVASTYCEAIDATVHLFTADRCGATHAYICLCGQAAEVLF